MALTFVGHMNVPNYTALSTDIASSAIPGASIIGGTVFTTDDAAWYIIKSDLTLASYAIPATFSGSIALGTVDIDQSTPGTTNGVAIAASSALTDGVGNYAAIAKAPGSVNSAPLAVMPMEFNGTSWDKVRGINTFGVSGAAVISADITSATLVTDVPETGKRLVISNISVFSDTAMNILFEEETSGTDIYKVFLGINGYVNIPNKLKLATVNKRLTAKGSETGNVSITVSYYSV